MASPVELGILRAMQSAAAAEAIEKNKAQYLAAMQAKEAELAAECEELTKQLASMRAQPEPPPAAPPPPPSGAASAMADIASMMREMPTEALADMLAKLRANRGADTSSAGGGPTTTAVASALPPSLQLGAGEATALVDILSMMRDLPTPALAELLESLRGNPSTTSRPLALELEEQIRGERLTRAPPPATAAAAARQPPARGADIVPSPTSREKALQSGRAKLLRSILLPYLSQCAPEEVPQLDRMLLRVVGKDADLTEEELFEDLEVAFGKPIELDPHARDPLREQY